MDVAAFAQELQQPRNKKGMAFRLALHESGQLAREIVGSKACVQITGDVFFFQQTEGYFFKKIVGLHPQLVSLQRMVPALDFGGAIGSNDEQAKTSDALAKMPQEINARGICPMEVLEEQHNRCDGRQSLQRGRH